MTSHSKQLVYENDLYKVVISDAEISKDFPEKLFQVINKTYDIIEMETSILMRALYSADDFEVHVKAHTEASIAEQQGDDNDGPLLS